MPSKSHEKKLADLEAKVERLLVWQQLVCSSRSDIPRLPMGTVRE